MLLAITIKKKLAPRFLVAKEKRERINEINTNKKETSSGKS